MVTRSQKYLINFSKAVLLTKQDKPLNTKEIKLDQSESESESDPD